MLEHGAKHSCIEQRRQSSVQREQLITTPSDCPVMLSYFLKRMKKREKKGGGERYRIVGRERMGGRAKFREKGVERLNEKQQLFS